MHKIKQEVVQKNVYTRTRRQTGPGFIWQIKLLGVLLKILCLIRPNWLSKQQHNINIFVRATESCELKISFSDRQTSNVEKKIITYCKQNDTSS